MLTAFNSFTIALHENAFNTIIQAFRVQLPRIFNFATTDLIAAIEEDADNDPDGIGTLVCYKEPLERNQKRHRPRQIKDLFTEVSYLPIPGYEGEQGISYLVQIGKIEFDFHRQTVAQFPEELRGQLVEQSVGLHLKICMGVACPDKKKLDEILDAIPPPNAPKTDDPKKDDPKEDKPPGHDLPGKPFPGVKNIDCFCLDVFAIGRIKRRPQQIDPDEKSQYLCIEVTNVEVVNLEPPGLENSFECLLFMILNFGVFPKLRMMVSDITWMTGPFSVALQPLSGDIQFNPAVESSELRTFLEIKLS